MVEVIENSNLLDVKEGIICHQVNCIGIMGGGIALQIRNKWPKVYESYKTECKVFADDPKRLLGHVQDIALDDNLIVSNCYGQVYPGYGCMTDYRVWDTILDKLKDSSSYFNLSLNFPWMVGCGLAGGDRDIMFKKITDVFDSSSCRVFIHKLS